MRFAARVLAAVLVSAVLASGSIGGASPAGAAAPGDQRCWLVNGVLRCGIEVESPGGAPGSPGGDGGEPTAVWVREIVGAVQGDDENGNATCTTADGQLGVYTRFTLRVIATGEVLDTYFECIPAGPAPPAPPPPPPTRQEIEDAVAVPVPAIGASPSGQGVTGMDSWFWADPQGPLSVSVTLRGWMVTGTVTPTTWTWSTGDGSRYTTSLPGSEADPAVEHVYETTGDREIGLQVTWAGDYVVTGYGTSYTVDDLDAENAIGVAYPVAEIRSVLDDPADGGR